MHYARILRAWLVAYGVGVPVLLVSQRLIAEAIIKKGNGSLITWLFLVGVAIQIIEIFIYKYSQEYLYHDETGSELKDTRRLALAEWFSNTIWFEIVFDLLSMVLFVCGTFMVVAAVLTPA
ncbi:MAG: hypothetical protein KGJ08_07890 [Gammaproteobacteria bacterium]|nr:hypothetical protein [Gammaproteobacteria bacterium]